MDAGATAKKQRQPQVCLKSSGFHILVNASRHRLQVLADNCNNIIRRIILSIVLQPRGTEGRYENCCVPKKEQHSWVTLHWYWSCSLKGDESGSVDSSTSVANKRNESGVMHDNVPHVVTTLHFLDGHILLHFVPLQ